MKFEFDSSEYQAAHGKKPSGVGSWAFEVPDFLDTEMSKFAVPYFCSNYLTLSQAKSVFVLILQQEIAARGLEELISDHLGGVLTITVCS